MTIESSVVLVLIWWCVFALASVLGCWLFLRWSRQEGWIDAPNSRSSHEHPTPTRAGAVFVILLFAGFYLAFRDASLTTVSMVTLGLSALAVAAIGWVDDVTPLPIVPRLVVQMLAMSAAIVVLGVADWVVEFGNLRLEGGVLIAAAFLAGVWFINLFNFMDGIDGIAASEAAFVGLAAGVFCALRGDESMLMAWLAVSGVTAGFLRWNWAPARLFMGDVGSGFLGFAIAMLMLLAIQRGTLSVSTCFILVAPFVTDATVTLVRRFVQGEVWYAGHRVHAYQTLSRRWGSHSRVTLALIALNAFVILPAALWAHYMPALGLMIAVAVATVLVALVLFAGAGRPERMG